MQPAEQGVGAGGAKSNKKAGIGARFSYLPLNGMTSSGR